MILGTICTHFIAFVPCLVCASVWEHVVCLICHFLGTFVDFLSLLKTFSLSHVWRFE